MLLDDLRTSLEYWRAMTPEERAEYGLPEVGWEQELFGHLGVDPRRAVNEEGRRIDSDGLQIGCGVVVMQL